MFERLKLNLYSDKLVCYAYDSKKYGVLFADFIVYLVIYDNNKYKFIKYKKIEKHGFEISEMTEIFTKHNIAPMEYWTNIIIEENSTDIRKNPVTLKRKK